MEQIRHNNWEPVDFTVYFSFIKWTALAALVLEILFRWWAGKEAGTMVFEQREMLAWIIRLLVFFFFGWRVIKTFGHNAAIAAIAGALTGFALGVGVSLFRFWDGFRIWKIFNLVTETSLAALVGALISVLVVYIFSIKN